MKALNHRFMVTLGALCLFFFGTLVRSGEPIWPNGIRPIEVGVLAESSNCEGCHESIAVDWRGSQHASSASDSIFAHSWSKWPKAWCLNCHLPLASHQAEIFGAVPEPTYILSPRPLHGEGVGCVTCHVREGEVLTPSRPSVMGQSIHRLRQEPQMSDSTFCAGCHQFSFQKHFPVHPFGYGDEPAQNTYTEWQNSGASAEGIHCQDCHMPGGAHTFPGAHDTELLQRTLSVKVLSRGEELEIRVSAAGVGHNVPTGDPFRRLVVELLEGDEVVHAQGLRRLYRPDQQSFELIEGTTLPVASAGTEASRTWTVSDIGRPTRWRLWIYYGDRRFEASLDPEQVRALVSEGPIN